MSSSKPILKTKAYYKQGFDYPLCEIVKREYEVKSSQRNTDVSLTNDADLDESSEDDRQEHSEDEFEMVEDVDQQQSETSEEETERNVESLSIDGKYNDNNAN